MTTISTLLPKVPYPPSQSRPQVTTERLLLRPLTASDLDAYHAFHSQPEVMEWHPLGKPIGNIEISRQKLAKFLPPNDERNFQYAICPRDNSQEMIGVGGVYVHQGKFGWPIINYMLQCEYWNKGYVSEFLGAFLELWWTLPREETQIEVEVDTVSGEGTIKDECVTSFTTEANVGSQKVMTKNNMTLFKVWEEQDLRCLGSGILITLMGYKITAPRGP